MDYLKFIARIVSLIPTRDKSQSVISATTPAPTGGKKASSEAFPFRIVEEELRRLPAKGWAKMIHWGMLQILLNLVRVPLFNLTNKV